MITLALVKFTMMRGNRGSVLCIPLYKALSKETVQARECGRERSNTPNWKRTKTQHKSTEYITAQRIWYGPWRLALITSGNTNQSVFHHLKLELLASSCVLFPCFLQKLLLELIYTICFYCWLRQFVPDCISTTLCVKLFCLNISESLNSGTHIGVVTGVILVCLAAGLTRALISPPLPWLSS